MQTVFLTTGQIVLKILAKCEHLKYNRRIFSTIIVIIFQKALYK